MRNPNHFRRSTKTTWLGSCMLFLLLLSLLLMSVDHKSDCFSSLRRSLSVLLLPIQYAVDRPVGLLNSLEDNFINRQRLVEENNELKQAQLLLSARLQRLLALEKENRNLKALLDSAKTIKVKTSTAQLLSVSSSPFTQQLLINKGVKQGVYVGQPVLDDRGVIGQVMEVSPLTSRVLLLTDKLSGIPVQVNRNGLRGIAIGVGSSGYLQMIHISDNADLKVGDVLVTSGLGQQFPFGYPVGIIASLNRTPNGQISNVLLKPVAQVNRSRQLLLVNPKRSPS